MKPIQELSRISDELPLEVLSDINRRITDWIASGGSEDDEYIEQQLRYARRFVK